MGGKNGRSTVREPRRRPTAALQRILGRNIRDLRTALSLSHEDLATRCGMHRTAIGKLERGHGNATIATLESLARALRCDEADLVRRRKQRH